MRQVRDEEPAERIPWRVLQDTRLSFRAAGILGDLLSRPDDWRTSAAQMSRERKEGRDAIETCLKELELYGYLVRRRVQYKSGQWGWVWLYGRTPGTVAATVDELLIELTGELHPTWVEKNLRRARLKAVEPPPDQQEDPPANTRATG
ncbi:hypothetical protein [Microcystis phage Mwe-JY05]